MDLQNIVSSRPHHFCQHTGGCKVEIIAGQKFCQKHSGGAIQVRKDFTVTRPGKKLQSKAARPSIIRKDGPRGMPLGQGLSRCSKIDADRHITHLDTEEFERIARIMAGNPAEIEKSLFWFKRHAQFKGFEFAWAWLSGKPEVEYQAVAKAFRAEADAVVVS